LEFEEQLIGMWRTKSGGGRLSRDSSASTMNKHTT